MFLLVNLIGFAVYYIHPAAPPWYVASHGFDFIVGTPGEVAGLGKWDEMTGLGIFHGLYSRNANVFAAMPSLHAAYMLIALLYSLKARCPGWMRALFAFICLGIGSQPYIHRTTISLTCLPELAALGRICPVWSTD